jgi:hypothetical protein
MLIMAEAYDAGLTPQQFADALPNPRPLTNWVMSRKTLLALPG